MYGGAPAADEAEVTLFGPGYGEAIAVHLGEGQWILIDSCVQPAHPLPASLHYLNSIGVPHEGVRAIIASHWHDDHVRGIAKLVEAYPQAEFSIADVFNDAEAKEFLAAYGSDIAAPQTRGARELHAIARSGRPVQYLHARSIVYQAKIGTRDMQVLAFSPTPNAKKQALLRMASFVPRATSEPINHAPELTPNLEAVVIHVNFGDDAILLASDLENHGALGWEEICDDKICAAQPKASVLKVGHHGSPTAHHPRAWTDLLQGLPIAVLTPFNNGNVHLPNAADKKRIVGLSKYAYISSIATTKPKLPQYQLKRMQDVVRNLSVVNADFGVVRLRKKFGTQAWHAELFGRAAQLAA